MTARETILRAWWASRRRADAVGAVTLDAAAYAGCMLQAADGDVEKALSLVPAELEVFWSRVRSNLEMVTIEERPAPQDAQKDSLARELGYENARALRVVR